MDHSHISQANAFILKLPDELLDKIISAVDRLIPGRLLGPFFKFHDTYQMAAILSRVCRRFNHISVPYMYSSLRVETSDRSPNKNEVRLLHRRLRENSFLWKLCQTLTVRYDGSNLNELYVVTDCISWLTAVKDLCFGCRVSTNVCELLRLATEHMNDCRSLSLICGVRYDLDLPPVIAVLGDFESGLWPHLRTLNLEGVSYDGDQVCQTELGKKAGTAPFTKLQLRHFLMSPASLEALVRWSKCLEEFELEYTFVDGIVANGFPSHWSLAVLQGILYNHRKTLRKIHLYGIGDTGDYDGFDLREFECLEELSLSSEFSGHQSGGTRQICEPPDMIFAPRLRIFRWDMTIVDREVCDTLRDFSQAEDDWLRLLARKALKHGCPLQKIEIEFTPEGWCYGGPGDIDHDSPEEVYPWDRMDAIGADLSQHGIEVSYSTPSYTREQFHRMQMGCYDSDEDPGA